MRKGMLCTVLAVAVVAAWGMPAQKEIDRVKPVVEELMAAKKRAKPQTSTLRAGMTR